MITITKCYHCGEKFRHVPIEGSLFFNVVNRHGVTCVYEETKRFCSNECKDAAILANKEAKND